ncbi:MAG: protein kinase domain-containing protein, partial [Limisphaerales bacterium]
MLQLALGCDEPTPAPEAEKSGHRIGRYTLLKQIGEGGCGIVHLAEQEEPVRRQVALKIIKLGLDTRSVIARFEAERQALALMDHPHIAKVFDAGATDTGRPYFVMELVRGVKITEYCDQQKLSTRQRLDLFILVCQAIQHAHQKGIIHRDIKPSNVLVTELDGKAVPKIIDFGIAKATSGQRLSDETLFTAFEQFLGTPAYMSPEQADLGGVDIDTRTDVYSLGVLLYELITGQPPFSPEQIARAGLDEMRRLIREQEPPTPSACLSTLAAEKLTVLASFRGAAAPKLIHTVRGDLDWIAMKALEKERARRYDTPVGLAVDIQRHLDNEPVAARPPGTLYKFQKFTRRNRIAVAAIAAVTLALIAGTVISLWQARQARQAEQRSRADSARSRQVAQLLKNLLAGVGPSAAMGRDTTLLREILDKSAAQLKSDLTNQPEAQMEMQLALASVYNDIQFFEQAETAANEALRLAKENQLLESPLAADAMIESSRCLNFLHEWDEGIAITRKGIALERKLHGPDSLEEATLQRQLCDLLRNTDMIADSESAIRTCLEIRRKKLGNFHNDVAAALDTY